MPTENPDHQSNASASTDVGRCFSIIPAAGFSQRMGEHKLLLPWRGGRVIDSVLEAWTKSNVARTFVVVRRNDKELQTACKDWPVEVLMPPRPPEDMKASIRFGIHHIRATCDPTATDALFVAPADLPTLSREVIDNVIDHPRDGKSILVPQFGETDGHPILIPWEMTGGIFLLKADEGIDSLAEKSPRQFVALPMDKKPSDIDTEQDYKAAKSKYDA